MIVCITEFLNAEGKRVLFWYDRIGEPSITSGVLISNTWFGYRGCRSNFLHSSGAVDLALCAWGPRFHLLTASPSGVEGHVCLRPECPWQSLLTLLDGLIHQEAVVQVPVICILLCIRPTCLTELVRAGYFSQAPLACRKISEKSSCDFSCFSLPSELMMPSRNAYPHCRLAPL